MHHLVELLEGGGLVSYYTIIFVFPLLSTHYTGEFLILLGMVVDVVNSVVL